MLPDELASKSPLEALSISRFGGHTYPQERVILVFTGRSNLLANNPNRVYWRAINEGAHDVRLSTDPQISGISGWLLQATGGTIEMTFEDDGETVGYQIYAITGVLSSLVRVLEIIRS